MNEDLTIEKWNMLHTQPKFRPKYPSELVVQYIFRNFDRKLKNKILDLGCGAGRHTYFMAREGIEVYGVDGSMEGIECCKRLFLDNELEGEFKVAPAESIPYKDECFDGLICFGVLYYLTTGQIEKVCEEIYRVLKKGAKALIVVRSTKDYRISRGTLVDNNTFIIKEEDMSKTAYNENGMVMHFFEEEEIRLLFNQFKEVKIDTIEETHGNGEFLDANYIISLIK